MKKIFLVFLLIGIATSCTEKVEYALFSGKIENPNGKTITVIMDGKAIKTINVGENNMFSDTIFNANGYYSFSDGKESSAIYLQNGYNLNLAINTEEFDESIVYTGFGNEVNNYLVKKFLLNEKIPNKDLYTKNETDFLTAVAGSKKELFTVLDKLKDNDFIALEKKNIKYEIASKTGNYRAAHSYYVKDRSFKVSETFPNHLEGIPLDNEEDFANSEAYKGLVISNFYKTNGEKAKKDSVPFQTVAVASLREIKQENIKNGIAKTLSNNVNSRNLKAKEIYTALMDISTDDDFKEGLKEKYKKMQLLVKGNPSPKFVNLENNAGGTLSLDDLKGKFVYIDVWATWCGPCLAQIPALKKVEHEYNNKNIEFVSISIDTKSAYDKWKKMIVDKELGGIQLLAEDAWKSKFVQDYGIKGIPRFILLDPKGNIISANAPRPSNPALISLLEESGV